MKHYMVPIIMLIFVISSAFGREECFPSESKIISSPSHEFELSWNRETLPVDGLEFHSLFFRRKGDINLHKIIEFHNQACVNWSPDEKHFTISHLIGSNISEVYIFESGDISKKIDVMELLPNNERDYFGEGVLHGYIKTIAWDRDGVAIRAWGDRENSPKTFDVMLKCSIKINEWTCRKTADYSTQRSAQKGRRR